MNILLLGGSNSRANAGYWKRSLELIQRAIPGPVTVTNLSVGGATTLTGLARLQDLPAGADFDLVVHEYGGSDSMILDLDPRMRAAEDQALTQGRMIALLLDQLAARFPNAAILPVICSTRWLYPLSAPSPTYDVQVRTWAAAGVAVADVRRALAERFGGEAPPPELFADRLHYTRPYGTDLVGEIVAAAILALRGKPGPTIAEAAARLRGAYGEAPLALRWMGPEDLAPHARGPHEIVRRENNAGVFTALRLLPGGRLRLSGGLPMVMAVLSDRFHDQVRVERPEQRAAWAISTRFIDIDRRTANPARRGAFVYTGVPLALILGRRLGQAFEGTADFVLNLDAEREARVRAYAFLSVTPPPIPQARRRLDIAGLMFVEPLAGGEAAPN